MTTIYVIRHAEAEGNLYRIVQGQHNSFITPRGHRQIACLAERFKNVHLDALYSSDLRRTVTTAGAITKYHELELRLTPRLREINLGVCEGMSFGDMYRFDPVQMDNFNNDPAQWCAPGAESFAECTVRIVSAVTEIAVKNEGKTVAVVSHGMAIRSLLAYILNVKSRDIPSLPHGDNTAVSKLIYDKGSFTVEYYNDNSHLPPELSTFARQSWWKKRRAGKTRTTSTTSRSTRTARASFIRSFTPPRGEPRTAILRALTPRPISPQPGCIMPRISAPYSRPTAPTASLRGL